MNIGTTELIVILILALFLYGKNLPEITRALGKGYREFKKTFDGVKNDIQKQVVDITKDIEIKEAGPNDSQSDNLMDVRRADKIYNTTEAKEDKPSIKDNDNLAG
ncbi:MAG TPA: twin-arginine translocase TatA/TatE family subunit [Planctomycetota bacterium]|nr:twin-arginine translocase TatA/TatE family subunit [Planctomycetota bacterium]